jgi:sulfonate transport system permease protein
MAETITATPELATAPPAPAGALGPPTPGAATLPPAASPPITLNRPQLGTRRHREHRLPRLARRVIGPLAVLGLWQLVCSLGVFTSVEVASPTAVFQAGRQLWDEGALQSNLLISLQRVAEGLAIGVVVGVTLAVASGLFWVAEDLVDPVLQAARAIPILGLVPLAIIWFGVGETPKVVLIALGCVFPIYINTFAAIRGVDTKLVEAGRTFGLRQWGLVRQVILPGSVPGFLVGLRFALVGSWLIIVVAEEINAQKGIGYLIMQAQTTDRTDIMFLGLAIYAILGLIADALVRLLERRLLVWRRGFTGG